MYVTDSTSDTTNDGSMDSSNNNENAVVCVTPTDFSICKSGENLKMASSRPSINEKEYVSIFNAPKDWNTIHQYCNHALPYHLNDMR